MNENTITVAEMSSFQLESIVDFRPKVSAILNFTPDHLNRHHTMEAYVNAKKNIARNHPADGPDAGHHLPRRHQAVSIAADRPGMGPASLPAPFRRPVRRILLARRI